MLDRYYQYQTTARGLLTKQALLDRFEGQVKWYNSLLKRFLPTRQDIACLDIACGYGNFLYFLNWKGYTNVRGYDLDPEQVKLAELLSLPAHVGDALKILETTSETFDIISAVDFIEHISKQEAIAFLDLCFKTLKPGGLLMIRTPSADGPFGAHDSANDLTHCWSMTARVLETLLMMTGFERVEILDEKPQPYKIINVIRLIIYYITTKLCGIICIALGLGVPRIWSRSMWGVAYKPGIPSTASLQL